MDNYWKLGPGAELQRPVLDVRLPSSSSLHTRLLHPKLRVHHVGLGSPRIGDGRSNDQTGSVNMIKIVEGNMWKKMVAARPVPATIVFHKCSTYFQDLCSNFTDPSC